MKKISLFIIALFCAFTTVDAQNGTKSIAIADGEYWWGGITSTGRQMPFSQETTTRKYDLAVRHFANQGMPIFISSKGRYIWSDEPFCYQFKDGKIEISEARAEILISDEDKTMREAFMRAAKRHFPSNGVIPNELFFSAPQYNTWIELVYNQNQEDILKYAEAIVENGYPTGVLMIDDNWQRQYGNYDFRAEKFPDPKGMIDKLHKMGFKVMLWVAPFVSADSPEYRMLQEKGYLLRQKDGVLPTILKWWNGYSAVYDLTNPECYDYVKSELVRLMDEYGVDGYKFDAGDPHHYAGNDFVNYSGTSNAYEQTICWSELAEEFEFNEVRSGWKSAGMTLVERLFDKNYNWKDIPALVSDMLSCGAIGYAYTCPDMIGGGQFKSFQNVDFTKLDQEMIVRSCQIHSLMPMMQFSVAPWRVLDEKHQAITLEYAKLHQEYSDYILSLARESSVSGEPIVRYMEYEFPGQGFESCIDQFMLGDKYLVAPMITAGSKRSVKLPKGKWVDEAGKKYTGGKSYDIDVPIERLPVFTKK